MVFSFKLQYFREGSCYCYHPNQKTGVWQNWRKLPDSCCTSQNHRWYPDQKETSEHPQGISETENNVICGINYGEKCVPTRLRLTESKFFSWKSREADPGQRCLHINHGKTWWMFLVWSKVYLAWEGKKYMSGFDYQFVTW